MKTITHYLAAAAAAFWGYILTPGGQLTLHQYPKLAALVAGIGTILALYHDPNKPKLPMGIGQNIAKAAIVIFFLGASPLHAQTSQTAQPVPAPTIFTMSGNYAAFTGTKTTTPAVIASAAIQLLPSVSVGYEHIQVTSSANSIRWELGVVSYTRQLNSLLGSTISNKLLVDTSQIGVTFSAGAGKLLQPNVNRIAETAGIHFSYPLADHISLQILGVDYLHGGVQSGFLTVNSTANISTGVNIYF